jgi:hypothetical protein
MNTIVVIGLLVQARPAHGRRVFLPSLAGRTHGA